MSNRRNREMRCYVLLMLTFMFITSTCLLCASLNESSKLISSLTTRTNAKLERKRWAMCLLAPGRILEASIDSANLACEPLLFGLNSRRRSKPATNDEWLSNSQTAIFQLPNVTHLPSLYSHPSASKSEAFNSAIDELRVAAELD